MQWTNEYPKVKEKIGDKQIHLSQGFLREDGIQRVEVYHFFQHGNLARFLEPIFLLVSGLNEHIVQFGSDFLLHRLGRQGFVVEVVMNFA